MKKTILSIAICSLTIVGCSKKNVAKINPTVQTTEAVKTSETQSRPSGSWRTFHFNEGDPYCTGTSGNCTDDAVITIAHRPSIDIIFNEIATGNNEAIQSAFIDYQNILLNYMYNIDISGVIEGTYVVSAQFNIQNSTRFMIIRSASTGSIIKVYPFK